MISRIMNDTGTLQNVISGATSVIVRDPVQLVGLLLLLLWRQPMLTLISMIVLPVCLIPLSPSTAARSAVPAARCRAQSAELMQAMTEGFSGHRVVKAYIRKIS